MNVKAVVAVATKVSIAESSLCAIVEGNGQWLGKVRLYPLM